MKQNDIIIKPVLTEKASQMTKNNVYTFEVSPDTNKFQIADLLQHLYKVKVSKVRVATRVGKVRKGGRKRQEKKMANKKIAYVVLKEGTIEIFPKA